MRNEHGGRAIHRIFRPLFSAQHSTGENFAAIVFCFKKKAFHSEALKIIGLLIIPYEQSKLEVVHTYTFRKAPFPEELTLF